MSAKDFHVQLHDCSRFFVKIAKFASRKEAISQQAITCSKFTIKASEKDAKYALRMHPIEFCKIYRTRLVKEWYFKFTTSTSNVW